MKNMYCGEGQKQIFNSQKLKREKINDEIY
jgi:hypothetical protein